MATLLDRRLYGQSSSSQVIAAWVTLLTADAQAVRKVDRDLEGRCGLSVSSFNALQQPSRVSRERLRMQELARHRGALG